MNSHHQQYFLPHEEDRKTNCNEEENKISIDDFEHLFRHLDDHGVRDVDLKGVD